MGDHPPEPTPFDLVVLLEDEWLLRPLLDRFLTGEREPAVLATPHGRERVAGFDAFFAALTSRAGRPLWQGAERCWALLGPLLDPALEEEPDLLSYPSPVTDDARVRRLAERYAWALAPWYGTHQEGTLVFVSSDPGIAQRFTACVERIPAVEVPDRGAHRRNLLLTRAAGLTRLEDAARCVLFQDTPREGWLSWRMARDAGARPLLFSEQTEAVRPWWRRAERRLEVLAEATVQREYGATRHVVYRSLGARSFDAVLFRGAWQGNLPDAILPGDTDPAAVLETTTSFAPSNPRLVPIETLRELDRLAACAGWAQGYSYGGGAEEYHALFCARDPRVAARVWNEVAAFGPDREDRRIGRL